MNKKISVIIPMYNSESYIVKTLEAIVNQSYKVFEILLIDDCSQDNGRKIAEEYLQKQDIKYKIIINEKNSGPSHSRNKGIEESTGDYILFIDSDDLIVPFYVEHLVLAMEQKKYDFVFSDMFECGADVALDSFSTTLEAKDFGYGSRSDIIRKHGYSCGCLFKTNIVKENNIRFCEDCRYMEDNIFNLEYLKSVKSVGYVKSAVYCYIRYDGSLTHPKDKMALIEKTKKAGIVFEKNTNMDYVVSSPKECTEFIQSRRYFINCVYGETHTAKYSFDIIKFKPVYEKSAYKKVIKNSNLSFVKKLQELLMLNIKIQELVYELLLK